MSNKCADLQNLDDDGDNKSAWKSIREIMILSSTDILGYYELKHHKPWCDDECSEL
jgi:hypothetical protein